MEPINVKMYVKKVTLSYVIGHYILFVGGLLCISYAGHHLLFARGAIEDNNPLIFSLVLGGIGLIKGGKVVYGKKIIRRED